MKTCSEPCKVILLRKYILRWDKYFYPKITLYYLMQLFIQILKRTNLFFPLSKNGLVGFCLFAPHIPVLIRMVKIKVERTYLHVRIPRQVYRNFTNTKGKRLRFAKAFSHGRRENGQSGQEWDLC